MRKWLDIAAVWMVLTAAAAGDDLPLRPVGDPRAALQDLQSRMSAVRSVYLEFTQERHLKLFTDPLKSEGVMFVDQKGMIRWETTAPFRSILLSDSKSVAQFENNNGEWKKLKLGLPQMMRRVLQQIGLMHQGKIEAMGSDFTISVATNSNMAVLTLTPKDETVRSMMSSIELRMMPDFSTTREVVMNEPGGDFTRIIFRRERRNVNFPAGTYDQNKPLALAAVRAALGDAP